MRLPDKLADVPLPAAQGIRYAGRAGLPEETPVFLSGTSAPEGSHGALAAPGAQPRLAGLFLAGAHGGAGVSTLADLVRAAIAAAQPGTLVPVRVLPAFPDGPPGVISARTTLPGQVPAPLVLVARANAEGARRAVVAVTALEYLGVTPDVLALVGDGAGSLPRVAAQRLATLDGRVGSMTQIPFAAGLRAAADTRSARLPARLHRAAGSLAALAMARGSW